MKRVIKGLIWLIVLLVVVGVGGAYLIPAETVVQRQAVIKAPPEKVFAIIGDLKRFNEWSPWAEIDPKTVYTFEGPDLGVGQKMAWDSDNPDAGKGVQTVTEFIDNSKVAIAIEFAGMGSAQTSLQVVPVDGGTGVTWGFKTTATGIMDRWVSLMFDRWIGADYEKGLAKLKALAEQPG